MRNPRPATNRAGASILAGLLALGTAPSLTSPAQAAETTAPEVTVAAISPELYFTGQSAQKVHVKATVTEDSGQLATVKATLFNPQMGATFTAALKLTSGTEAQGTWEGDVVLPQKASYRGYWSSVTATDAAGNAGTGGSNTVQVQWYQPYRPDVRFVDECGMAQDRVLHDSHGRVETWGVTGPVTEVTRNEYTVDKVGSVQVNLFVPKDSSTVISQDGSTDTYAATFSHTFTDKECEVPTPPLPQQPAPTTKPAPSPRPAPKVATVTGKAPALNGTVRVGTRVRVKDTGWTKGATLTHQWLRNGKAIKGATATSYVPKATDRGARLQVRTTGAKKGMKSLSLTSRAVVVGAKPVAKKTGATKTGAPKTGAPKTGAKVTTRP